ncbi:uncharacterized protein [Lolium perenne]|uniref:uncharacterized protein n=1 Tax=Lolium perenne TaxID=4522 RepID=UPI0021F5B76C|nr:jacalin-related lectin 3-like [Lolium perenne]
MKAAVATNVTVDLEDLDCTVCFGPLKPPVFQCAAGHALCSICYEKLPEKEKCQVCSITTGHNRFLAMESALQSIQVLCSNARNGCTAKMPYHEMEEHEKECMNAFCDRTRSNVMQPTPLNQCLSTDCYTLVIPKFCPSTSINISINNSEAKTKIHDKKSSTDSVMKMGPCGGSGGNAWKMDTRGVNRIFRVIVRHGWAVDAMSVLYERDGQEEESKLWGGTGGQPSEICLRQDEYLTSVKGHYGFFNEWFVIRSLTFVSNRRTFGPYGKEEGAPFKLPACGGKIIGFHGLSDGLLDAFGTYVKMG